MLMLLESVLLTLIGVLIAMIYLTDRLRRRTLKAHDLLMEGASHKERRLAATEMRYYEELNKYLSMSREMRTELQQWRIKRWQLDHNIKKEIERRAKETQAYCDACELAESGGIFEGAYCTEHGRPDNEREKEKNEATITS